MGHSIVIWSDCANIPNGWTLCDGDNGTPDLQGRFVVGGGASILGTTFNYGDIGGSTMHDVEADVAMSGSVGSTSLSTANLPSHTHNSGWNVVSNSNTMQVGDGCHCGTMRTVFTV